LVFISRGNQKQIIEHFQNFSWQNYVVDFVESKARWIKNLTSLPLQEISNDFDSQKVSHTLGGQYYQPQNFDIFHGAKFSHKEKFTYLLQNPVIYIV
jgi:hypothetical protein